MRLFLKIFIAALFFAQPLVAAQKERPKLEPLKDAVVKTYKSFGADDDLKMYIFNPDGHKVSDKRPAIVFFFGGGWTGGTPTQFAMQAKYLASRGMVAICADYRTMRSHKTSPYECVKDAKSAVRWIRVNAKGLGVDPKRIVASGGSAGGHIAAATGTVVGFDEDKDKTVSSVPNAMVLFNAVFDNGPHGYGYERVKDHYKEFSPIDNIRKGMAPTLVMLGTRDKLIPVETAEKFKRLAEKIGSRCDLKIYEGQKHGFFNMSKGGDEMYVQTVRDMDVFLASLGYLKGKPTIESAKKQGN